jgi:hypothetical protein
VLILALVVPLSACDVFDPDIETELGTVFFFNNPVHVTIPAVVDAGEPFTIDVRTYGNSCVTFSRTEIETDLDDRVVEIRPYDRNDFEDDCQDILQTISHPATLRFGSPGAILVRVIGTRMPNEVEDTVIQSVTIR